MRLSARLFVVDASDRLLPELTEQEVGTILGTRWWTPAQMTAYDGRFFPSTLPGLLPRLLAGERVDEPFDHGS